MKNLYAGLGLVTWKLGKRSCASARAAPSAA